jgi:surface antigen
MRPPQRLHRSAPGRISLILALLACGIAAAPSAARDVRADQFDRQIQSLNAQASRLAVQLRDLQRQQNGAAQSAVATQARLEATQASLAGAQSRLDRDNIALATTAQRIESLDSRLAGDRAALTRIVRRVYTMSPVSTVNAIVDSRNMYQLMDTALTLRSVSAHLKDLVTRIARMQADLRELSREQQHEQSDAAAAVVQLRSLQVQQETEVRQYQQEAASLSGDAAQVAGQSKAIVDRIASLRALQAAARHAAAAAAARAAASAQGGDALPPFAFGPREDDFPWGQCTWYVASLRDVSWGGDAWEWIYGARAAGRPTGMTPKVGSIVVWGPGNGYSGYGHVAYVVDVAGPSDFTVDESNYYEIPGRLDQRHLTTLWDVEGFIY